GQEYHLRPSHEAIEAIEAATGRSAYELAGAARAMALPLRHCAIVAAEMMKAYARTHPDDPLHTDHAGANPRRVAEMIHEAGSMKIQPRLAVVLIAAVTGGVDAAGEMKPATASPPPAAG
ncbi:MAG TPA: hypothetical protein VEA60_09855, partial [Allosphingosinicella sp.]|nr:hypothetical protein [Allosphingosinicella sp.]